MKTITTILAVLILTAITFSASPAEAGPRFAFYAGFGMPVVVSRPGPDYVWVKGHYKYNVFGQLVWVPAHWKEI